MLKKGDEEEIYYMRLCCRCNNFFFVTAKHCKVCEDCQDPSYKKFFKNRGIKYLSYNDKKELKGGNFRKRKWKNTSYMD